jgi:hypothetical protein
LLEQEIIRRRRVHFENVSSTQAAFLIMAALGGIGILLVEWLWPNFYDYPYLYVSQNLIGDVLRFWPAFAWGGGVVLLAGIFTGFGSSFWDEEFLQRGVVASVGAGVTEELWFRGVSVFYAIISLIIFNWIVSAIGWVFVIVGVLAILMAIASFFFVPEMRSLAGFVLGILGIAATGSLVYGILHFNHDPVYMVYQHLFYPIINFVTFGKMGSVLYGDHAAMLIMGMISTNFAFRDGHKYQGLFGWTNSWFMGCVLMFATMTYGLVVAVIVHALYDIIIDLVLYVGRKIRG